MPIKEIWNGAGRLWKDCGGEEKCKEEEEEEEGEGEERNKWGRDNERKGRKEKGRPMNKTNRKLNRVGGGIKKRKERKNWKKKKK